VVAEGAGEELLGKSAETDAGGNRKLPAIGEFLKSKISEYFKQQGSETTIKYVDPSYMIRSVPANASDSLYCMLLASNAVHGAMVRSVDEEEEEEEEEDESGVDVDGDCDDCDDDTDNDDDNDSNDYDDDVW